MNWEHGSDLIRLLLMLVDAVCTGELIRSRDKIEQNRTDDASDNQ